MYTVTLAIEFVAVIDRDCRKSMKLTGEQGISAAIKRSHLPSRRVRCDRGGSEVTSTRKDTAEDAKSDEEENREEKPEERDTDHARLHDEKVTQKAT